MHETLLPSSKCSCCGRQGVVVGSWGHMCASCMADVKCCNHQFCGAAGPRWCIYFCHAGTCMNCSVLLGNGVQMDFKDGVDMCCICMTPQTTMMKFPADGCKDWFCTKCCHDLLYFDESLYDLDPTIFGCPPCPAGCKRLPIGPYIGCVHCDDVRLRWSESHQAEYAEWCSAQDMLICRELSTDSARGSKSCPVCRRKCIATHSSA